MPTQRHEEKRVDKHATSPERERERKKEKKPTHAGERGGGGGERRERREREAAHAHRRERKHSGSSFYKFFPPPGPVLCKSGLARSAVCST